MSLQEEASPEAPETMMLNPCDREDSRLGAMLAWLTEGTDCRCCIGARIAAALCLGVALGLAVGLVWRA